MFFVASFFLLTKSRRATFKLVTLVIALNSSVLEFFDTHQALARPLDRKASAPSKTITVEQATNIAPTSCYALQQTSTQQKRAGSAKSMLKLKQADQRRHIGRVQSQLTSGN